MKALTHTYKMIAALLIVCGASLPFAHASQDNSASTVKVSVSEFQFDTPYVEQAASTSADASKQSEKHKQRTALVSTNNQSYSPSSYVYTSEFWIYDSWVTFDRDIDYDGYYSGFTVEFDADTYFSSARVYAVLYLGRDGLYDAIHVSSEFNIYGEDASDSFVIESTLLSGFPPSEYDVLVEIYDAHSDELLAYSDSYDDADLAYLSLESDNHEYIYEDTVVIVEEHGGSTGVFSILALLLATLYLKSKKSHTLN